MRIDMLRSICFYFLLIVFVIFSWSCPCDSRHLLEKKVSVNQYQLNKNNEKTTKEAAILTNKTYTVSSQAHVVVNHGDVNGQLNGKRTKNNHRVKRASSKRVSRTWKVPKYSKKQPISDHEHPAFNLDYMQPTTHPPHHN